eukprot:Platyproteum_vivax@DN7073_c0_g1_i4.p1
MVDIDHYRLSVTDQDGRPVNQINIKKTFIEVQEERNEGVRMGHRRWKSLPAQDPNLDHSRAVATFFLKPGREIAPLICKFNRSWDRMVEIEYQRRMEAQDELERMESFDITTLLESYPVDIPPRDMETPTSVSQEDLKKFISKRFHQIRKPKEIDVDLDRQGKTRRGDKAAPDTGRHAEGRPSQLDAEEKQALNLPQSAYMIRSDPVNSTNDLEAPVVARAYSEDDEITASVDKKETCINLPPLISPYLSLHHLLKLGGLKNNSEFYRTIEFLMAIERMKCMQPRLVYSPPTVSSITDANLSAYQNMILAPWWLTPSTDHFVPVPIKRHIIDVLSPAMTSLIPHSERGDALSVGSLSHCYGDCKPCAFHVKGCCLNGVNCLFCHFSHVAHKRKVHKKL